MKSILNAWYKKGIRSVEQEREEQVAFEIERKQKQNPGSGGFFRVQKEDIVPDWFEEEKQKSKERREHGEDKKDGEVTQAEVEEMMKRYWEGT